MSNIKECFEEYGPKTYESIPTVKRAIGPIHLPWSIPTLEGVMLADVGDYVIEGVNGEFYPCKPDIFKKSYRKI